MTSPVPTRRRLSPTAASFTPASMSKANGPDHDEQIALAYSGLPTPALGLGPDLPGLEPPSLIKQRASRHAAVFEQLDAPDALPDPREAERRARAFMVHGVPNDLPYLALASFFDVSCLIIIDANY